MAATDHPVKSGSGSADDMGADELATFQKIMGEIDGSEEEKLNGTAKDAGAGEKEEQASTADDLLKVAKEADAVDNRAPTEAQSDESDDGLDEDQQQALESIMAQIEGGGAADADTGSGEETEIIPDPEPEDDFSAELEKVVQEADAVGHNDSQDAVNEAPDDVLNEGQQKELEIDDILKSITTSEDDSPLPEKADDEPVAEPAAVDTSENTILDDDIVVIKQEDLDPEHPDSHQPSLPAATSDISSDSEEAPAEKSLSGDQPADIAPVPASSQTPPTASPLRESSNSTKGGKKKSILVATAAMVLLALAGYYFWMQKGIADSKAPAPATETSRAEAVVETQPPPPSPESAVAVHDPSDQSRLKTAADNLDDLRNTLIEKQAEIEELRAYYQAGIDAEIQGVVDTVRQAGKGKISFKAAMADPQISLRLSAIQRRDTYIKKLIVPANTLFRNSEELLFFSRKAGLLALMATNTSDIDIDGFIEQADQVRRAHGSVLAQLNIDAVEASLLSLESIWQDIAKRLPARPVKSKNILTTAKTGNAAIWKKICDGDFTRKHRLTVLSAEAARCLAAWKGKDLFLNGLTELSAEAARQLAAWEGDWLGLNGLAQLSPEAAMHLSRWKGKKLSLNGLSRLSPRVVAILSEWQGDQIELVNVKHMAHWENANTRLFLSEDLNRKRKATRN